MKALDVQLISTPSARSDLAAPQRPKVPLWKRSVDLFLVLVTAPLWLPVGFVVGLCIKFLSPGPVLFKQMRMGFHGELFCCLKFRTMVVNADSVVHNRHLEELMKSGRPMTKLDTSGDKRLIRGGKILRALGLDELPQLLNVIRGEMSLVGPRPCVAYESAHYQARHRLRFGTLPGLTGLWQVNGKNRTTFEEMIEWDIKYVEQKSPFLDILIILKTFPVLFAQGFQLAFPRTANGATSVPITNGRQTQAS